MIHNHKTTKNHKMVIKGKWYSLNQMLTVLLKSIHHSPPGPLGRPKGQVGIGAK